MLRKAIVMKTLPKNIMTPEALDMCENYSGTFKNYGDVFAIDSDMDSVCLSYTDTGIDITDLAGLTLSEAIAKLPSFGIRALYWKDTDHRMQYGTAGEIWTKDYLSDLPTAWSVVDEMCDTPVWDCVVTGFYYDTNTGWFCIIIDEPVIGCLTRSLPYAPEDFIEEQGETNMTTCTKKKFVAYYERDGYPAYVFDDTPEEWEYLEEYNREHDWWDSYYADPCPDGETIESLRHKYDLGCRFSLLH